MTTLRSLGRFYLPLLAIFLILTGLGILFSLSVPSVLLGVLALVAGILALFAS